MKHKFSKILGIGLTLALLISMLVTATPVAAATTITVASSGATYTTIQAAINAAAPGDTINVAAGTYTEQLLIQKDIVLIGAGVSSTIVQAPAGTRS
ncbi:MAG: pectinesterase family protein, partial [Candidatus Contubernalis sp.]|nr:pectinesterase family protein [Candidatus Contubernalis sp.]